MVGGRKGKEGHEDNNSIVRHRRRDRVRQRWPGREVENADVEYSYY